MNYRSKKGGSKLQKINMSKLLPVPHVLDKYNYGNDPRLNAIGFQASQQKMQNNLNNIHGGKKLHQKTSRKHNKKTSRKHNKKTSRKHYKKTSRKHNRKYNIKGGSDGNDTLITRPKTATVVQFPQVGPQVSSVFNANNASKSNNQMKIDSINNATNDHYAYTNSIPTIGGKKRKTVKNIKNTTRNTTRNTSKNNIKNRHYKGKGGSRNLRTAIQSIRSKLSNPYNYPLGSSGLDGTKLSGTIGQY